MLKISDKIQRILKWFYCILLIGVIPIFFILSAYFYQQELSNKKLNEKATSLAEEIIEELRYASNVETYFCQKLNTIFAESVSAQDLQIEFNNFRRQHRFNGDYCIFKKDGEIVEKKLSFDISEQEVKAACQAIGTPSYGKDWRIGGAFSEFEFLSMKKLFGRSFYPIYAWEDWRQRNPQLLVVDSQEFYPKLWLKTSKEYSIAVYFTKEVLSPNMGLKKLLQIWPEENNTDLDVILGHFSGDKLFVSANGNDYIAEFQKLYPTLKDGLNRKLETGNFLVFSTQLGGDRLGICCINKSFLQKFAFSTTNILLLLVFFVIFMCFLKLSWNIMVRQAYFRINIGLELGVLFVISISIPMSILGSLAFDYLGQLEKSHKEDVISEGMLLLRHFDELSISQFSYQLKALASPSAVLKERVKKEGLTFENFEAFLKATRQQYDMFLMVSSSSRNVFSNLGIMYDNKVLKRFDYHLLRESKSGNKSAVKTLGKLNKYFISKMNHSKLAKYEATEMEMMIEAIGQRDTVISIQEYFENFPGYWRWGLGNQQFPTYIDSFDLWKKGVLDYCLMFIWPEGLFQREYINRQILQFNKNSLNMRIFTENLSGRILPEEFVANPAIKEFANQLGERGGKQHSIIRYNGIDHLILGMKGIHATEIKFMGIYPLTRIEKKIFDKKLLFAALGIICLLITLAIGIFLSQAILGPLKELGTGILALQNRNFNYRLPDLGENEFGSLARIFNRTLEDIGELQVASVVQEKLLPKIDKPLKHGNLSFYGKTVSLDEVGGDYFDLLEISENKSGIILGDVTGHGVSAALIMAFVKSCVILLKDFYLKPVQLVNSINKYFRLTTNRKQNKFMTFLYILFDNFSGEFEYANKGHCFPIIVNAQKGETRECKMVNFPLGASNKTIEKSYKFKIEPGEALILYTDGLFEGKSFGFKGFKQLLVDCYDSDPFEYYQKVISICKSSEDQSQPGDDNTLIIICRDM